MADDASATEPVATPAAKPQSHAHDPTAGANSKRLAIALALTGTFLLTEVAGGIIFNSLALLSDAAHMFTDAAALAIALVAIRMGQKAPDDRRTFGYRRFEILAAAFNAILLFAVAGYVLVEGVRRLFEPVEVGSTGMLIVAFVGLVVNLIAMKLLAARKDASLNVKGAYLEVWADMLGSLGVILGAVVIRFTGWTWVDPVIAVLIGLWVLPRTWILLRDTTNILLESTPRGLSLAEVRKAMASVSGVAGVHDLHAWTTGADDRAVAAHLELAPDADGETVRIVVTDRLYAEFDVRHVTLQVERDPCRDRDRTHL